MEITVTVSVAALIQNSERESVKSGWSFQESLYALRNNFVKLTSYLMSWWRKV